VIAFGAALAPSTFPEHSPVQCRPGIWIAPETAWLKERILLMGVFPVNASLPISVCSNVLQGKKLDV